MRLCAILIKPVLATAIDPVSLPANAVLVEIVADTGLLSTFPAALILTTITPDELSFTMALILQELANVLLAIRPDQVTVPMHFVILPLALEFLLVAPDVDSLTLDFVHLELTLVD